MRLLLPLFIAMPILEMVILIKVGGIIGALPTVAMVVLTATIGLWLLKREGLATLQRVQSKLNEGQLPETELLEGIMLLIGGALLLTPGFVTDGIGFVCLLPFLRQPLAAWLIRRVARKPGTRFTFSGHFQRGQPPFDGPPSTNATPERGGDKPRIIEGEFEEKDRP